MNLNEGFSGGIEEREGEKGRRSKKRRRRFAGRESWREGGRFWGERSEIERKGPGREETSEERGKDPLWKKRGGLRGRSSKTYI